MYMCTKIFKERTERICKTRVFVCCIIVSDRKLLNGTEPLPGHNVLRLACSHVTLCNSVCVVCVSVTVNPLGCISAT